MASDTICAVATPGTGALGIVRVSGPQALALVQRLCRRRRFVPRTLHLVALRHPQGEMLDRALVCYMPAPRTYTGEDVVEIYAHGGERNLERLHDALLLVGARRADPGEFTRRAFLSGRIDLSQAEAVAEVIAARGDSALRNAHALLAGALGDRVRALRQRLIEAAARLEAEIDFAEELDAASPAALVELRDAVRSLADTYEQGRLIDGARLGIVGPVNVGKSTLFNGLLGTTRAVVCVEPGTTRDYLEAEVSWGGRRVTLVDTAGWRMDGPATELERAGQVLAAPVLKLCDLLLAVVDLSAARPSSQLASDEVSSAGPRIIVANKCDQASAHALARLHAALCAEPGETVVATSALRGDGIDELRQLIIERLFPAVVDREGVWVSRRRHYEALAEAVRALDEGASAQAAGLAPELVVEHVRQALAALEQITGERAAEEVLDEVFSRFCIGK